ncbi:hypothetical protein TSUD_405520 [Trifolium subterraneum]|uniref:Reverse transcriptase domain-containing protein n=1 Tax=Trifolium subterraneum TaxID=3900 RepID=A0A2Z6PF99_TRISU|nr:hypothetical protein TSUD_405520 [Trifolium subterraneum]
MTEKARSKVKKVVRLVNEENVVVTKQGDLCEVAKNYFDALFKASDGNLDPVLSIIQQKITDEDNERLTAPISKEEIHIALMQMHPDKSPGPDGFNPAFYQHLWHLCGDDIFVAVKTWLDRGFFPTSLNETNICLIPKCDNPSTMKDLRPIALCNVLYKMVSKLLANRLRLCLDKCISEEQLAFVEGRSILDNALIAMEVIHALKRRTRGRIGELALKIDISKAYDKVDWGFLKGMLLRLGFSNKWVQWMMMCVSTVNYSVLMNFDKVGPIYPGRGLRQGDPLSPYLFILATEGLTALIKQSIGRGELHGIKICRGAPMVSHLLFADDCFMFCRANISEATHLMSLLDTYSAASGQEINLSKSEVFFSRNLSTAAQEDLSGIMGVKHVMGTGTYLGLPSMVGRSKKATFGFIKDRIWKKINSWRGRALSKAGKDVMIKSVLQAIPAYIMSVYLVPDSIISDIEKMLNSFWWGDGSNNKGIRWLAWDRLARPKAEGGLGYRNFHVFNKSLIAKQAWKFMTEPDKLVSRIFKARWRIGDGSNIKIMQDPWLRGEESLCVPSPQSQMANSIISTPLLAEVTEDQMVWIYENHGEFTVKFGYNQYIKKESVAHNFKVEGENESPIEAGNVAMVVWCIWHNRNNWVWNGVKVTAKEVAMQVVHMVGEWRAVHTAKQYNMPTVVMSDNYRTAAAESPLQLSSNVTALLRWQKPRFGWWKCNVDASLSQNPIATGWGWCVRNSDGVFIAAGTNSCMQNCTAAEGEALAVLEAMRVAISKG